MYVCAPGLARSNDSRRCALRPGSAPGTFPPQRIMFGQAPSWTSCMAQRRSTLQSLDYRPHAHQSANAAGAARRSAWGMAINRAARTLSKGPCRGPCIDLVSVLAGPPLPVMPAGTYDDRERRWLSRRFGECACWMAMQKRCRNALRSLGVIIGKYLTELTRCGPVGFFSTCRVALPKLFRVGETALFHGSR